MDNLLSILKKSLVVLIIYFILAQQPYEVGTIIIPILQMRN